MGMGMEGMGNVQISEWELKREWKYQKSFPPISTLKLKHFGK